MGKHSLYAIFLFFALLPQGIGAKTLAGEDRFAIVVGIGEYPPESGWNRIHGDMDVGIVTCMLLENGFQEKNITVLKDSAATKSAIETAFSKLAGTVSEGDIVHVHFSTHGQQVTDTDGDEPDGLDEAIIPYDAMKVYSEDGYHGENHIIDDELYVWLSSLRAATGESGLIFVTVDACHSGDSTRGERDEAETLPVRGTAEVFMIPEGGEPALAGQADGPGKRKETGWVSISACKSYQNNYEFCSPDGLCGRLTWALSETLEQGIDFQDLVESIEALYDEMPLPPGPPQNPDAEAPAGWNGKIF